MILQYKYVISTSKGERVPPFWAYRIYSWLLTQLPNECGDILHMQGEKPISQFIAYDSEKQLSLWVITLMSPEIIELLSPVLETLSCIPLITCDLFLQKQSSTFFEHAEDLLKISRNATVNCNRTEFRFLSTTAFKHDGRFTIFPQLHLILQSLVNKWNVFCPEFPLEDSDAFYMLENGLSLVDYNLRSSHFLLKGASIPGFYGSIIIASHLSVPMEEIWQLLLAFAPFSGIGVKTTLGMGGVDAHEQIR